MYDLIGDIHGYADELLQLLKKLGYRQDHGVYAHPERKVIFLGDFIDRGPKIREVLDIVRPMVEQETALAVMGNHELNALAYHTTDPANPGEFLRPHSPKNKKQHQQTLDQLKEADRASYLDWFRALPLWLDLDGLRVVHACWDTIGRWRSSPPPGRTMAASRQASCSQLTGRDSHCLPRSRLFSRGGKRSYPTTLSSPTRTVRIDARSAPAGT